MSNKNKEKKIEDKEDITKELKKEQEIKKSTDDNNEELSKLQETIKELNEKILLNDKNLQEYKLRTQADLQNYKRRQEEELEKNMKYKNEDIIKELLPIIDNFERAIKMDDNDLSDEVSKFLEGFKIVYTSIINLLNKYDVKEVNPDGAEFDPTYHHAVLTEHDETKPSGVVLEVLQKGYIYKDRVVRPAMVKVNE